MNIDTYNSIEKVSIQRLEEIQSERESTISNPEFIQWCKDMKIGARYTHREGINRANDMMKQWSGRMSESERLTPGFIRKLY